MRRGAAWAACVAVVALPMAAAWLGARGPRNVTLNLGPGDSPYVAGFAPHYEIDDKVATHWTTYHAEVAVPVVVHGPAALTYRYARMFVQSAQVEVAFAGRTVDRFEARGGLFAERSVDLGVLAGEAFQVRVDADSHERRDRGLKLDWVRLQPGDASRVRLAGASRWRGAAAVLTALVILILAGWRPALAAALCAPISIAIALGLSIDPWITHRLLTAAPESLLALGVVGLGVGRFLIVRGHASPASVRTLAALCLAAFALRLAAVNHPDFYYPDLRTHARLVEVVRAAGLDFFRSPSRYIWEHGVWRTEAYGQTYAFPYSPAFHLPFTLFPLSYDVLITVLKIGGAAVSLVPLVLVWAMARRIGASTIGAALMVLIPTYTSRLSFAFLPSLFGHAVDMAFFTWLLWRLERFPSPRVFAAGVAWVTACQLAYVSGVTNISLFVFMLAVLEPRGATPERLRRGALLLAMGLLGSAVSVALYYRDFLGMVADMLPRIGGAHGAVSRYQVQSWFAVAYERTRSFFDGVYPVLAVAGLVLMKDKLGHRLRLAWMATYLLLLLGRAKVPDVFLHGHETLLLTPLVCLAAGETLGRLWANPRGRWVAGGLIAFLAGQGLLWQWRALAEQLANAR